MIFFVVVVLIGAEALVSEILRKFARLLPDEF